MRFLLRLLGKIFAELRDRTEETSTLFRLAIAVSAERLLAIKSDCPLRSQWKKRPVILIIISIFLWPCLISFYHFAWYTPGLFLMSVNGTNETTNQSFGETEVTEDDPLRYWYVYVSHASAIVFIIIAPLIILIVLNCFLVTYTRAKLRAVQGSLRNHRNGCLLKEQRVTWAVIVVVTAFIICDSPSGVWAIVDVAAYGSKMAEKVKMYPWYNIMKQVGNATVITNRTINIALLSCANREFRRRLLRLITLNRCGTGKNLTNMESIQERDRSNHISMGVAHITFTVL